MQVLDNVFEQVASFEQLNEADDYADNGKRYRQEVLDFQADRDANLLAIREDLLNETYQFGPYRKHWVYVPKKRMVMALPYRDRVVQWSIYLTLNRFYDKQFIEDSYACRKGKGTLKAALRLQYWLKLASYKPGNWKVVKLDISKFFYRVNHRVLIRILRKRIKDKKFMRLLWKIINESGEKFGLPPFTSPDDVKLWEWLEDLGMPIGNLTSQLFANIYLNELDQFCKHVLKIHMYIRYMDDIIFIVDGMEQAKFLKNAIETFLKEELHLDLNKKTCICTVNRVEFVGFIVTPRELRFRKQTARRIKRAVRGFSAKYFAGRITKAQFERRVESYKGMMKHVSCDNLKRRLNEIYISEREKAGNVKSAVA